MHGERISDLLERAAGLGLAENLARDYLGASSMAERLREALSPMHFARQYASELALIHQADTVSLSAARAFAPEVVRATDFVSATLGEAAAWEMLQPAISALPDPREDLLRIAEEHLAFAGLGQSWIDEHIDIFGRLVDLSELAATRAAFDLCTAAQLESVIGFRDSAIIDGLSRATGLRRRREIYRDIEADTAIEDLPWLVLDLHSPTSPVAPNNDTHIVRSLRRGSRVGKVHARCYVLIGDFECFLRAHVQSALCEKYGDDWMLRFEKLHRRCLQGYKRRRGLSAAPPGSAVLLDHSDFNDLIDLIRLEYNENQYDLVAIIPQLIEIKAIRNSAAHYHALLKVDWVALRYSVIEVRKALGAPGDPNRVLH